MGTVNDFWEFDLDSQQWERIITKDQPSPRQQYAYCSYVDGEHEYFLMYGGKTRLGLSSELWE